MGKRLAIPAMKREILYLVVEKAVVDNIIDTDGYGCRHQRTEGAVQGRLRLPLPHQQRGQGDL